MIHNQRFKQLLDEGIRSVAARQGNSLEAVEIALAEQTGYSRATVHYWRRGNPPPELQTLEQITRYCVHYGRLNADWVTDLLEQGGYSRPEALLAELFSEPETQNTRIFICYARGSEPDQTIALTIAQELSHRHEVFFDQAVHLEEWVAKIEAELAFCDYFVLLLSPDALTNEVVLAEMEMAWQLRQSQGKPQFLPIEVKQVALLPEQLHVYLAGVNQIRWQSDNISFLLAQLQEALVDGRFPYHFSLPPATLPMTAAPQPTLPSPSPAARPFRLEMPEGAIDLESKFYVVRSCDPIALEAIAHNGITMTIKGPRQVGKSSLLIRVAEAARERGKKIVFLDFQLLHASLQDADLFFRYFCTLISHQLEVEDKTEQYWQTPITNAFRCTQYVRQEILANLNTPVLLALDEVDAIFESAFRTDFFSMLRSWHNNRARDAHWKKLDLALVTSTEPYYFVQNLSQSPFNVGEIIDLPGFSSEQVAVLNKGHGSPFPPADLAKLMALLRGHPYLVRRALYLVASKRIAVTDLLTQAAEAYGPFGDHLRSLLLRLHHNKTLLHNLHQVLQTGQCSDDVFFRLHGAGLIMRENGRIVPRCPLYADFFNQQLHRVQS